MKPRNDYRLGQQGHNGMPPQTQSGLGLGVYSQTHSATVCHIICVYGNLIYTHHIVRHLTTSGNNQQHYYVPMKVSLYTVTYHDQSNNTLTG